MEMEYERKKAIAQSTNDNVNAATGSVSFGQFGQYGDGNGGQSQMWGDAPTTRDGEARGKARGDEYREMMRQQRGK